MAQEDLQKYFQRLSDRNLLSRKPSTIAEIKECRDEMPEAVMEEFIFGETAGVKDIGMGSVLKAHIDRRYYLVKAANAFYLIDTSGYDYPRYVCKAGGALEEQCRAILDELAGTATGAAHSVPDYNLGDANPYDHGGYFLWKDGTAVYFDEPDSTDQIAAYRFTVEPNALKDLNWVEPGDLAGFAGIPEADILAMSISDNIAERAEIYQLAGSYYGWDNLDSYPLRMSVDKFKELYPFKG